MPRPTLEDWQQSNPAVAKQIQRKLTEQGHAERAQPRRNPQALPVRPTEAAEPTVTVPKGNKYHAEKTVIDGYEFDSRTEAKRYTMLKAEQACGSITGLELQPVFNLTVNGHHVGIYTADFRYRGLVDGSLSTIVEDVKSRATMTEAYGLRKLLCEAIYDFTVQEWPPVKAKRRVK